MNSAVKHKLAKELEKLLKESFPADKESIAKRIKYLIENEESFRLYINYEFSKINSNTIPTPLPQKGTWWRAINRIYDAEPLSVEGSRQGSARFHKQGQDTVYLTESSGTSNLEVQLDINLVTHSFWAIDFSLGGILDLTDPKIHSSIGISNQLLYGLWDLLNKYNITSYSQLVSSHLRRLGYEGLIYESTKDSGKKCLVIFVDNMKLGSFLEVHDKTQGIQKQLLKIEGKL